jgi:small neutral amino acid transporter SnatA (MarC family)
MVFELRDGDVAILFFLTLGPLKAILPFARVTHGTEPAFQRTVAWRGVTIGTVITLAVAILGPLVLLNWHVSAAAIVITCAIILFYQALHVVMQTPAVSPVSAGQETAQRSPRRRSPCFR